MEKVCLSYPWRNIYGKSRSSTIEDWFPMTVGSKSVSVVNPLNSPSRGLDLDCLARQILKKTKEKSLQQFHSMDELEINDTVCQINESVLIESGRSIHCEELFATTV